MPLIETKGAASAQGFGEFAQSGPATYIEDVFSTYLYTGTSATQTITNGIDLSTKGGLVWVKRRSPGEYNILTDTARGAGKQLFSDLTASQSSTANQVTAFNTNGFTLGADSSVGWTNLSPYTYVSWTFRKQPKFFDVVTYTGASPSSVTVNHNLGSVPGCIIIKCINDAASWAVYHRSTGIGQILYLNGTQAASSDTTFVTAVTSTSFTVGDNAFTNNSPSKTYVAYLFAHNAGGFGLTGSDNVISCGSYNGSGAAGNPINLGYEPQWLLIKSTLYAENWYLFDSMRGMTVGTDGTARLYANTAGTETILGAASCVSPTATGFSFGSGSAGYNQSGETYIYVAIRRGPMKVPTSGTSVFSPVRQAGGGTVTTNFVVDTSITKDVAVSVVGDNFVWDRLRGSANGSLAAKNLITNSTAAESAGSVSAAVMNVSNTAVTDSFYGSGYNVIYWNFRRAPNFFDVVCYTGDGGATKLINHNLGVAPELLIVKIRGGSDNWWVYNSFTGSDWRVRLNASSSEQNDTAPEMWGTTFSSTQFQVGNNVAVNNNATSYVAYLFATCPGVSKVGTYTGTGPGTLITVNCGFTSGARFVLIRRLYGGDWYVYDSARGISSGSDPYLTLNGFGAEVTGTNYVDTTSVGFQVTAAAPYELNTNGLTFLFLAIA